MPLTHARERGRHIICNAATLIESWGPYYTEHTEEHFTTQLKTCRWHPVQVGCVANGFYNSVCESNRGGGPNTTDL
jgi:hypothetical protein